MADYLTDGGVAEVWHQLLLHPDFLGQVLPGAVPALPHGDDGAKGHHGPGEQLNRVPAMGEPHVFFSSCSASPYN